MLGLVVFGAHYPYNARPVQPTSWTKDMGIFLQWLTALSFNGGGLNEAAIAEGLSNALMMFPSNLSGIPSAQLRQRHCILVAASNPSPLPMPVILPKTQFSDSGEISKVRIECHVADAEAVARSFSQSFVSLSVICPRRFSRLREIYIAGNSILQAAESFANEFKHPQFLVLVSKRFQEAYDALKQLESVETEPDLIPPFPENFSEDDLAILQQILCEPSTSQQEPNGERRMFENEIPSEWRMREQRVNFATPSIQHQPDKAKAYIGDGYDLAMLRRRLIRGIRDKPNIFSGDIPTEAEEVGFNALRSKEASIQTSKATHSSYIPDCSYNRIPSIQTSLNIINSQGNVGFDNFKLEITNTGTVLSHGAHPGSCAQASELLSNVSPQYLDQGMDSRSRNTFPHNPSLSVQVKSNALVMNPDSSISLKISQPSGVETTFNLHQTLPQRVNLESLIQNTPGGRKATTSLFGPAGSQPLANRQQCESARGYFYGPSMAKDGYGLKRKYFNSFGQPNVANDLTFESVGVDNISSIKMPPPEENHISNAYSEGLSNEYIKAWEGGITLKERGQMVLVNRLVAYRKESQSDKIFANWPRILHMDHLISLDHLNNIPYHGDVQYLILEATDPCLKFHQLKEKRLGGYVKLPQQTLILSASAQKLHGLRLIGILYQGIFPVYKHQIFSP